MQAGRLMHVKATRLKVLKADESINYTKVVHFPAGVRARANFLD